MTRESYLIDEVLTRFGSGHPNGCPLTGDLFESHMEKEIGESNQITKGLEEKLGSYIQYLKELDEQNIGYMLRDHLHQSRSIRILVTAIESGRVKLNPHVLQNLILFSPFWIRSYNPNVQIKPHTLLDYFFVEYDVPAFLYSEWEKPLEEINYKWIAWFLLLGQGGSIKKSNSLFNWSFSTRIQPYLWEVPECYCGQEGVLYAWVLSKKGTRTAAEKILEIPFFSHDIDPTAFSDHNPFISYWMRFMRWLLPKTKKLSGKAVDNLLESAELIYRGEMYAMGKSFKWKGRSPRVILREYENRKSRIKIEKFGHDWQASLPEWTFRSSDGFNWKITEITNSKELEKEGLIMHHCVLEHIQDYLSRQKAVFSLTCNGKRRLTIELCLEKLDVIEMSGVRNRTPTVKERVVIHKWMEQSFVCNPSLESIVTYK